MNREQFINYYDKNNVPLFHGNKVLDSLKYLSELEMLPDEIKQDYYSQYEAELCRIGISQNKNFGKLIFEKFKGENPIEIGEIINTFTYKGVTFRSITLKMSRFERVFNYFKEQGISFYKIPISYSVLDIEINGISTLNMLWKKTNKYHLCPTNDLNFLCDEHEYAILNYYHKPYNGIVANKVVQIFQEICEKTGNDRYSNSTNAESYIKGLIQHYGYSIDIEEMLKNLKEIFQYHP